MRVEDCNTEGTKRRKGPRYLADALSERCLMPPGAPRARRGQRKASKAAPSPDLEAKAGARRRPPRRPGATAKPQTARQAPAGRSQEGQKPERREEKSTHTHCYSHTAGPPREDHTGFGATSSAPQGTRRPPAPHAAGAPDHIGLPSNEGPPMPHRKCPGAGGSSVHQASSPVGSSCFATGTAGLRPVGVGQVPERAHRPPA